MNEIRVQLGERSYSIHVQMGLLDKTGFLLPAASRVVIVTDDNVGPLYAERVRYSIGKRGGEPKTITMPAGEHHKTRETLALVHDRMFELELDRSSLVVALGGGVVGDLAGFAAATYMRGIRYAQIPTTLLASVDSSVGGKTGINHPLGKNMIGAFHQPSVVIIDPATLRTLPEREVRAGMAEVIKYGVIRDAELFAYLETYAAEVASIDEEAIQHVISRCCTIKAGVVAADEREGGLRAILNYGHTLGHALEAATAYSRYRHGEAVAIGMNLAAKIAHELGMIGGEVVERQAKLIAAFGLPIDPPADVDPEQVVALLKKDKKVRGGKVRFVLPTAIGSVELSDSVPDETIRKAL